MNQELWNLAVEGLKKRKRNSLLLFLVLVIAFSFSIVGLSLVESMNLSNEEYRYENYGTWHTVVFRGREQDASMYEKEQGMEVGMLTCSGKLDMGAGIGVADETLIQMGRLGLLQGNFPQKQGEAAMEANVLSRLGYSYKLGQPITLQILMETEEEKGLPDQPVMVEKTFTLCGVLRSYSHLWNAEEHLLPGILVTEQEQEKLRQQGLTQAKKERRELKEKEVMYYFKTKSDQKTTVEQVRKRTETLDALDHRGREVVVNTHAYQKTDTEVYPFIYFGIIFVTAGVAVLCIYSVRIKKQVQQIALFRSIGITKKQLRKMLFYETVCLAVPAAVTGILGGGMATWLALRYLAGLHEKILVKIPFSAFGILFFLLLAEIVMVRALVLQIALKQPLTGRMYMKSREIRRHRIMQRSLSIGLAVVFCAVIFFTVLQSVEVLEIKKSRQRMPDYRFESISWQEEKVKEEDLQEIRSVPGIRELHAWGNLTVDMKFSGMEKCELFREVKENTDALTMQEKEGLTCRLYGIPEEDWDYYLDFEELSIDREAFKKGEEVLVLFSVNSYGETEVNGNTYQDTGLKKGDELLYEIYGNLLIKDSMGNLQTEERTKQLFTGKTRVAEILKVVDEEMTHPLQFFATSPYTILCSSEMMAQILEQLPEGYWVFPYETGEQFQYSQGEMFAMENAGFLSTDVIVADLFGKKQIPMESWREENTVTRQELKNRLILYGAGGGTVLAITFLMLWNILSLEAEEEKRKIGILRTIGLSDGQVEKKILRAGLLLGAMSVLGGFVLFGGYLYLYAWMEHYHQMALYQEKTKTILEILLAQVESYRVAGIRFWHLVFLSFLSGSSLVLLYFRTKITVLKTDLSKLLREG